VTEHEWLTCTDPVQLLEWLEKCRNGHNYQRKLILFNCACCRRIWWPYLTDERSRTAVEITERFADGLEDRQALRIAESEANSARRAAWQGRAASFEDGTPTQCAALIAEHVSSLHPNDFNDQLAFAAAKGVATASNRTIPDGNEPHAQCELLRDVFGLLPFRLPASDLAWLSATITRLAQAIYEEHAFDRLPILADALDDCGCNSQEVLSHLRGGGEHCRGCWPLDLVLRIPLQRSVQG
jgi:hypothetical protein